jgi:hypothetical protein
MPTINLPDATYELLATEAMAHNTTVEQLILERLHSASPIGKPNSTVLQGEAWQIAFEKFHRDIAAMASSYPPGFQLDVSRDAVYDEQLRRQM